MSVHQHPMEWAREMDTLLGNGTINKDNYLTDCANAVVYVRESAEKITQLQTELAAALAMISKAVPKRDGKTCCQCNWSNGDLLNMAQEPNYAPEWWCHGCLSRLVNAHRDETGKFIKLNKSATVVNPTNEGG